GDSLPRSKGGDSLPQSKGGDSLPRSKGGDSLPQSKGDDALPTSQASEEDIQAVLEQESQAGDDNTAVAEQPDEDLFDAPDEQSFDDEDEEDLFAAPIDEEDDDLFADPEDDDDLFGEEDDDLFEEDDDDDLFAAPVSEESDPFAEPVGDQESDPFAEPAGDQESDPFAEPVGDQESDLFGEPSAEGGGLEEDSDDLFAAPIDEEDDDDLFEEASVDEAGFEEDDGGQDFLSGNDSFTFLDDDRGDDESDRAKSEGLDVDDDPAGESGRWGEDLMGNAPPEASAADARATRGSGGAPSTDAPSGDDPFRPASPGPRQPASSGPGAKKDASAQTTREEAVEEDKKRGLMTMIGVPLVAILVLGGAGYGLYTTFLADSDTGSNSDQGDREAKPVTVDLQTAKTDNYGDLQGVIDEANNGELKKGQAPRLLLVQSLYLARHDDEDVAKKSDKLASKYADAEGGWEALARGSYEAQRAKSDAARSYLEPLVDEEDERAFFAHLFMGIGDILALEDHLGTSPHGANEDVGDEAPPPEDEESDEESDEKSGEESDEEDEEKSAGEGDEKSEDEKQEEETADSEKDDEDESDKDDEAEQPGEFDSTARQLASRADAELERAAKADPDSAAPLYWRGRLYHLSEEDERAIESLEAALEAAADHVASRLILGQIYHERGELNEAVEHLSKIHDDYRGLASSRERAQAYHLIGQVHTARQETVDAIDAYTEALNIDPERTDTLRALAEEYMTAEEYDDALNFFTSNEDLGEEDPEVMIGIVRAHMGLEEWDKAITKLEQAEEKFPKDARFPYYLGKLNRERGAFHDAAKAYERALEIDSQLLPARAALARLAWMLDEDHEEAEKHVAKISEKPDAISADVAEQVAKYYEEADRLEVAEQWYEAALERDPNHWSSRLSLARMYLDHGNTDRALELLKQARDEGIDDLRLSAYLADAYRQSDEHSKAIDQINDVIDERPKDPEYIFIRGRIYFDQGNYDTARKDFNQAYEIDPEYHEAYFFVGRTAFEEDDYQRATKIFRHVLDYVPDEGKYHYWMGRTYEAQDRPDQALDAYDKATAVDEDYGEESPMLFVRRGRLLGERGNSERGKKEVERALEIDPDMKAALTAVGDSLYGDNKYEEAIEHYRKVIEQDPEEPKVRYRLGMSLLHTDQEVEGAEHLQEAVRYGYDDPDVFKRLGYLYKDMNKNKLAIESFKEYLKRVGEEKSVPAATKREMINQIEQLGGSL
ncbi:MAG: tetratricopeptide repeat protein, partial [Persicimonas sp.]